MSTTDISHKPPPSAPVSASPSSSASSNIKIERVLSSSSTPGPSTILSLQVASHPPPAPPLPPPPPPTTAGNFATASLHSLIHPDSTPSPIQHHQHRQQQPLLSDSPSSPDSSMATAAVASNVMPPFTNFTKPIRFVANDGQPHAKRRRISAACKTCRKRKTRCSGEKPTCETCRQNGHPCLGYTEPTTPASAFSSQNRGCNEDTPTTAATTPTDKEPSSPQGRTRKASVHQPLSRVRSQKRKSAGGCDYEMDCRGKADGADGGEVSDEGPSHVLTYQSPPSSQRLAHRMPYFRYFGPTAIVPGYKQMVVEVKDHRPRHASHSMSANSSGTSPSSTFGTHGNPNSTPTMATGTIAGSLEDIPFYDPNDAAPNDQLIAKLVETFFQHLGCNFPFLRREVFTKDVKEKRVEGILVDAVCAVAARFLDDPPLQASGRNAGKTPPSEYGTAFANRAKSQVVDTFTCPNLATVQACILLAYVEFGSNRDSGLWMFLGIAIRMAQDLGLQKLQGTRGDIERRSDGRRVRGGSMSSAEQSPTAERGAGRSRRVKIEGLGQDEEEDGGDECVGEQMSKEGANETKARERERSDTFWAVFFLDRVIASGTGRPVAIRDSEIEIDYPPMEDVDPEHGFPPPFPALIRIIQLYGRITDLLNSISDLHTVTPRTLRRLSGMEADLTSIYQRLSPNLHFGVSNFQHYAATNQGAVFLLLHFWFHTLIVLLHRPTLLIAFEGRIQQLFPNSRELSMSSAKTIADILAFAELLDSKVVNGNPFTSQPIYIAACAFLQESAAHSASNPTSRSSSPPPSGSLPSFNELTLESMVSESDSNASRPPTADRGSPVSSNGTTIGPGNSGDGITLSDGRETTLDDQCKTAEDDSLDQKLTTKHALLAQAAHQNYQRCYKALKVMETYWEGVKYILTVMDQKAKGIVDPLLYTAEEMESVEVHRWGALVRDRFQGGLSPGAESGTGTFSANQVKLEGESRQSSHTPTGNQLAVGNRVPERVPSPLTGGIHADPSLAIGWSVSGTINSPNSHLTFMFPANNEHVYSAHHSQFTPASSPNPHHHGAMQQAQDPRAGLIASGMHPPLPHGGFVGETPASTASMASTPQSKYQMEVSTPAAADAEMLLGLSVEQQRQQKSAGVPSNSMGDLVMGGGDMYSNDGGGGGPLGGVYNGYGIMIESEDVNMNSMEANHLLPFLEFIPGFPSYYGTGAAVGDEVD